jgi:hypothetical protein
MLCEAAPQSRMSADNEQPVEENTAHEIARTGLDASPIGRIALKRKNVRDEGLAAPRVTTAALGLL